MADLYEYYNEAAQLSDDATRNYILLNQQRLMQNQESIGSLTDFNNATVTMSAKHLERIKALEDETNLLMIFLIIVGVAVALNIIGVVALYCMGDRTRKEAAVDDEVKRIIPEKARYEFGSRKQIASSFRV
jgi:hypothetical protein